MKLAALDVVNNGTSVKHSTKQKRRVGHSDVL
jgi:hypothetical protein